MANNSLDDRLAALYQKRDHIDQFYDADLKTIIDAIRDAREHGGTASVDITPISGGGGYTITITDSEGTEHTATVKDGGDAYEVYKSTVPSGQTPISKTDWLASLKGDTGDTGEQGPTGPQGVQGLSAFEVWKETTGRPTATEAEYIADLQNKVVRWIPVAYEATAASASIGDTVTFTSAPSNPIDGAIVLMPNAGSSATATMMFAVSEDPNTQGSYIYTYIGDLNVDTTGLLGQGDVDGTGLVSPAPNALAKAVDVMPLKGAIGNTEFEEEKYNISENDIVVGYIQPNGTVTGTGDSRSVKINVVGYNRVRLYVTLQKSSGENPYKIAFWDENDTPIKVIYLPFNDTDSFGEIDYIVDVPNDAMYILSSYVNANTGFDTRFYCYLQKGKTISDNLDSLNDRLQVWEKVEDLYIPEAQWRTIPMMNCKATVVFDNDTQKTIAATYLNIERFFDYVKVNKGDIFRIFAKRANAANSNDIIAYMFDVPPIETGISGEKISFVTVAGATPLENHIIEAPRDGYLAIYKRINKNTGSTVGQIASFRIDKLVTSRTLIELSSLKKKDVTYPTTVNKLIDIVPSSDTFGEEFLSNDSIGNYGTSDYIDIEEAEFIESQINHSAATYYISNSEYRTISFGTLFFDENKEPIDCNSNMPVCFRAASSDNTRRFELYNDDNGLTNKIIVRVPEGAKYIRVCSYRGGDVKTANFTIYYKSDKEEDTDVLTDILEQAQYVKIGKASSTPNKPFSLIHFTDIHADTKAADAIKKKLSELAGRYDDVICSGDVCDQYFDSTNAVEPGNSNYTHGESATYGYLWWTNITKLASKCLFVIGNHDGATASTTEYDTKDDSAAWDGKGQAWAHDTYFAPYANELGITLPTGYNDSTSPNYKACYWYKKYTEAKILLIGLDCMHRYDGLIDENGNPVQDTAVKHATMEQEIWLKGILESTLDSTNDNYEYSVLFVCHYPLDYFEGNNETWDDEEHKFIYNQNVDGGRVMNAKTNSATIFHDQNTKWYRKGTPSRKFNMRNRVASGNKFTEGDENHIGDIINSWIDDGGKCIAWVNGHTHADYMFYPTKYPNILCVTAVKAGNKGGGSYGIYNKMNNPFTMNMYVVDTNNNLFKIIRLGLTLDYRFEQMNVLCYDYVNKQVISEW